MNKYRAKLNWNKELEDLRELKKMPSHQPPKKEEWVAYNPRTLERVEEQRTRSWLSRTGNIAIMFLVITGGVFMGGYILTSVLANIANDALKEAISKTAITPPTLPNHQYTTVNYGQPKPHINLREDRQPIIRHSEMVAEQRAKELRAKMKREEAFKAFYTKPERCIEPINSSTKMDCINEHVRAWKEFNISYKD